MAAITFTPEQWDVLKLKFRRKYNHLSDEDLAFEAGQEDALIARLAKRVNRNTDYVLFTLQKGLADLESNRL
jgi:predicted transcriptional regulator